MFKTTVDCINLAPPTTRYANRILVVTLSFRTVQLAHGLPLSWVADHRNSGQNLRSMGPNRVQTPFFDSLALTDSLK